MADTDVLIKDLPLTETVNDSDDLVTEDSSPTTHRIKASVVKNYINAEQNEELDGIKVDLDNTNANIGSLSSKVDDATTTVSNMQTNLNTMDGRVQANADGISELNSALADLPEFDSGTVTVTISASGTVYSQDISFSKTFGKTPQISLTAVTSYPNQTYVGVGVNSITNTGFTLNYLRSSGTGSFNICWIAIAS